MIIFFLQPTSFLHTPNGLCVRVYACVIKHLGGTLAGSKDQPTTVTHPKSCLGILYWQLPISQGLEIQVFCIAVSTIEAQFFELQEDNVLITSGLKLNRIYCFALVV